MSSNPHLNTSMLSLMPYATKSISSVAKATSAQAVLNLAIGEPEFGPPEHLKSKIEEILCYPSFHRAVKEYEQSKGSSELREAIARWYLRRYGHRVDPDSEIVITHGGVEAITLAILCTSDTGDSIALTDPTYMLYARAAQSLGRRVYTLRRPVGEEYAGLPAIGNKFSNGYCRTLIINSPENPTGYMLSDSDWAAVAAFANAHNLWVVHDEVYDTMAFGRRHVPARYIDGLNERSVLINSCSKKFGVPGLRIGWLCGPSKLISLASKLHDYLYLGVNKLAEDIALVMLRDPLCHEWLEQQSQVLSERANRCMLALSPEYGFAWDRQPYGAMFAFPNIQGLDRVAPGTFSSGRPRGDVLAEYLMQTAHLAVVPGSIYGREGADYIRLVLCGADTVLDGAINRLQRIASTGQDVSSL